ncbi:tetratricopeptide repeat protein [Pseudonocardia nigra]|uniref:tetratricopeptide repeat protein n=1 Tax=Pseudonocardia nigra TaxID=1921578 RepID=UPI001C5DED91|nr:tetratricopeptide repeat protein [Pseudonocardia nigra]
MTDRQVRLRQLADQAVRDIVELDVQVAAGEVTEDVAQPLRRHYENLAGRALEALDAEMDADATDPSTSGSRSRHPLAWALAYALAGAALVAAVILLPASVVERPAGGFVTGNEAVQGLAGDPSAVSNDRLEEVVAANPEVVGMRLALADRYVAQGAYGSAMRHYLEALRREPDNADGLAGLSWLLLQIGQPEEALATADQALTISPSLDRALWYKANIQLYGLNDPAAARVTLQELSTRDLTPQVRDQVDRLLAAAREDGAGEPG